MMTITRRTMLAAAPALAMADTLRGGKAGQMKVAVATYSLRKFSRPEAIARLKALGVRYVCIKEFHLPYKDSPEALRAGRREFDAADIQVVSGGVVNTTKEPESAIRRYFEYGRTCGMPMLIMMPTAAQLPEIARLAAEFDIRAAVHNHGPEDKNFPTPESAYEAVRGLDKRVGLCIDIGHSARAGVDVVRAVDRYADRLLDIHIKDLRELKSHSDCEVGTGVLPVAEVIRTLAKHRYSGCLSLEYEAEPEEPGPGMRSSIAYMRGVLAGLGA